ncbi:MAG: hypothetical protein K8R55_00415, partial [Desulfuromonadaceae bacterium]|nr:hypothetical protein [Desulfuromonadaceae bacterium]
RGDSPLDGNKKILSFWHVIGWFGSQVPISMNGENCHAFTPKKYSADSGSDRLSNRLLFQH